MTPKAEALLALLLLAGCVPAGGGGSDSAAEAGPLIRDAFVPPAEAAVADSAMDAAQAADAANDARPDAAPDTGLQADVGEPDERVDARLSDAGADAALQPDLGPDAAPLPDLGADAADQGPDAAPLPDLGPDVEPLPDLGPDVEPLPDLGPDAALPDLGPDVAPRPETCDGTDEDLDGLIDESHGCHQDATCLPAGRCACNEGFVGDGLDCRSRCEPHPCGAGRCIIEPGGFSCDCAGSGFAGELCDEQIDECAEDLHDCADEARCLDRPGRFLCLCPPGQAGDGRVCEACPEGALRPFAPETVGLLDEARGIDILKVVDLDADGDLDLLYRSGFAVIWSRGGPDGFAPPEVIHEVVGQVPRAFHVLRVDADERPDLLILLFNGFVWRAALEGGGFGPPNTVIGDAVRRLGLVGDVDGDGAADVLMYSGELNRDTLYWYRNEADGFGAEQALVDDIRRPLSAHMAELDGGGEDLIIVDLDGTRWHRRTGPAEFEARGPLHPALGRTSYVFVDWDGDGDIDVYDRSDRRFYLNGGAADLELAPGLRFEGASQQALFVDIDRDGALDFVGRDNRAVYWTRNVGNERSGEVRAVPLQESEPIAVADVDGDGDLDFVGVEPGQRLHAVLNDRWIGPPATLRARAVIPADVDGDGFLDVVAEEGGLVWYRNRGDLSTEAPRRIEVLEQPVDRLLRAADLDRDGDVDLIVSEGDIERLTLFRNAGGEFAEPEVIHDTGAGSTRMLQLVDLNGDELIDVLWLLDGAQELLWLRNLGDGFAPAELLTRANRLRAARAGDLDGDGDADLLVGLGDPVPGLAWLRNEGAGVFAPREDLLVDHVVEGIELGDLDGDERIDVLIEHSRLSWLPQAEVGFEAPRRIRIEHAAGATLVDLDEDGDLDVLASQAGRSGVFWMANDGSGAFAEEPLLSALPGSCPDLHAVDLDGDGDRDLLGHCFETGTTILLRENVPWCAAP